MCGIAGVVDLRGAGLDMVGDQVATLEHRGPDSAGVFAGSHTRLAQSRLAVIDLATGDPPLTDETGSIGVVFNGELYNFRELRHDLSLQGHRFTSAGDTEVIAHLAEDLEPVELGRRLQGMFAFAVWDERRRRLILGRDRFGKKPLYYWSDGTRFVFGSEIKAVLADPRVPRSLDPLAVPAYLSFGYVPTPRTFFEGVTSLPPAHVLTLTEDGETRIERYWRAPLPGVDGCDVMDLTFDEACEEIRRLLSDAVARRMVADVGLGAFLSGGVDSSVMVALMARLSPGAVRTFTIGFDDGDGFDERPYAEEVAKLYSTDHTTFVVDPDRAELVERLVWHHDQPFGDSSALPTFLLCQLTREHVTVALAGDGGDEIFGGYERFVAARILDSLRHVPNPVLNGARSVVTRLPPTLFHGRVRSLDRLLSSTSQPMPDAYLGWLSCVPDSWRHRLCPSTSDWARDLYREQWAATAGAAGLDRLLALNLDTYLVDDLLVKVDRMAMAHGLEVRSPYLDTALAEFALRLPPRFKVRGLTRKRALRAMARDLVPPALLRRRKRGFGVPLDRWFRTDLRSYAEARLCADDASINDHLRPDGVRDLFAEHQSGANRGHALWALLTLETFLRQHGW